MGDGGELPSTPCPQPSSPAQCPELADGIRRSSEAGGVDSCHIPERALSCRTPLSQSESFFKGRTTSYSIILGKHKRQLHTRQTDPPSPALREKKHFLPLETWQSCSANYSCSNFLSPFSKFPEVFISPKIFWAILQSMFCTVVFLLYYWTRNQENQAEGILQSILKYIQAT